MNNFHQIPNMWSLEISRDGQLRTAPKFPYVSGLELMKKYKGLIPKFLASTFIGPIDLPIIMLSQELDGYKLTYAVKRITQLDEDEFDFDGNLFRRIPGFSDYLISESGVTWSISRQKFMHVAYNHAEYDS